MTGASSSRAFRYAPSTWLPGFLCSWLADWFGYVVVHNFALSAFPISGASLAAADALAIVAASTLAGWWANRLFTIIPKTPAGVARWVLIPLCVAPIPSAVATFVLALRYPVDATYAGQSFSVGIAGFAAVTAALVGPFLGFCYLSIMLSRRSPSLPANLGPARPFSPRWLLPAGCVIGILLASPFGLYAIVAGAMVGLALASLGAWLAGARILDPLKLATFRSGWTCVILAAFLGLSVGGAFLWLTGLVASLTFEPWGPLLSRLSNGSYTPDDVVVYLNLVIVAFALLFSSIGIQVARRGGDDGNHRVRSPR